MRATIEKITPEMAREWLLRNTDNRPLTKSVVSVIVEALTSGSWQLNGATIKIAANGRVLDGQHRLSAIAQSGVTADSLVVYGVDDDAFTTIDIGKRRTGGDTLGAFGVQNATIVAAALGVVYAYHTGRISTYSYKRPPNAVLLSMYKRYGEIEDSIQWAHPMRRVAKTASMAVGMHHLFSQADAFEADRFISDLTSGAMMEPNDPVLRLRDQLMQEKLVRKLTIPSGYLIWLYAKAWNLRRKGRSVRHLRIRLIGPKAEAFPGIDGVPADPTLRGIR